MYLNFQTYQSMGGSLDEAAFSLYSRKAEQYINSQANGRTKQRIQNTAVLPDEVLSCVFDLIPLFQNENTNSVISRSQSDGSVSQSESYAKSSGVEIAQQKADVIDMWLSGLYDDYGNQYLYLGTDIQGTPTAQQEQPKSLEERIAELEAYIKKVDFEQKHIMPTHTELTSAAMNAWVTRNADKLRDGMILLVERADEPDFIVKLNVETGKYQAVETMRFK